MQIFSKFLKKIAIQNIMWIENMPYEYEGISSHQFFGAHKNTPSRGE